VSGGGPADGTRQHHHQHHIDQRKGSFAEASRYATTKGAIANFTGGLAVSSPIAASA